MKLHRIFAVILRHWYNFRRNLDRLVDAFYWPVLDVVLWGLTFSVLQQQGSVTDTSVSIILFAIILWFVVWRGQGDITVNLLEELWSENLTNLFASPLKLKEWVVGLCTIGLFKLFLTIILTSVVAWVMYGTNFLNLGWMMVPMLSSLLLMSWAFGFMLTGLFLRYGTSVQTLAWAGAFILMPFSAVYYPLSFLPPWAQMIGYAIPSSYIFEGMRALMLTGVFPLEFLLKSFALDVVYLILAMAFFISSFNAARNNGLAQLK